MIDDWRHGGFGIYIHWPFCQAKCPYCDFNSHVSAQVDHARWRNALAQELEVIASYTVGRTVDTIFFGGGTPSLMEPDTVASLIQSVKTHWPGSSPAEVTLEANPTSVEASKFEAFAQAGVNRISMGIQSLRDRDLRALGRLHSAQEARQAYDIARESFDNVSFDMIYARQDQSVEAWRAELAEALAMAVDHISAYQLTIEPGTAFGRRFAAGQLAGLPGDDVSADMYDLTNAACAAAGLPGYEVSNYARPDRQSVHNLIYWRYGDYAGIGPGAHGRLTRADGRWATDTPLMPDVWLQTVETQGSAIQFAEQLAAHDQLREYVLMSLRLSEGTDLDRCRALCPSERFEAAVDDCSKDGLIDIDGRTLKATARGRLLLNHVIATLVAEL